MPPVVAGPPVPIYPRSAVPPAARLHPPGAHLTGRPDPRSPGWARIGTVIVTGALTLWIPFTVVIALAQADLPTCVGSIAVVCTRLGHAAGMWSAAAGGVVGLAIIVVTNWIRPSRRAALWTVVGLAVAALGFLTTVGLFNSTPLE